MRARGLALVLLISLLSPLAGAEGRLPLARDFQADASESGKAGLPILVFFSAASCPYCEIVEDLYLEPMCRGGSYRDQVLFRVVRMESAKRLRDFDGKTISHSDFAQRYKVHFTPVIKFLDAEGKELAPALVGMSTPDFYYGELEAAIDRAVSASRNRAQGTGSVRGAS